MDDVPLLAVPLTVFKKDIERSFTVGLVHLLAVALHQPLLAFCVKQMIYESILDVVKVFAGAVAPHPEGVKVLEVVDGVEAKIGDQ